MKRDVIYRDDAIEAVCSLPTCYGDEGCLLFGYPQLHRRPHHRRHPRSPRGCIAPRLKKLAQICKLYAFAFLTCVIL